MCLVFQDIIALAIDCHEDFELGIYIFLQKGLNRLGRVMVITREICLAKLMLSMLNSPTIYASMN